MTKKTTKKDSLQEQVDDLKEKMEMVAEHLGDLPGNNLAQKARNAVFMLESRRNQIDACGKMINTYSDRLKHYAELLDQKQAKIDGTAFEW